MVGGRKRWEGQDLRGREYKYMPFLYPMTGWQTHGLFYFETRFLGIPKIEVRFLKGFYKINKGRQ